MKKLSEEEIKNYRESYQAMPGFARKMMAEDGTPYLSNITFIPAKCGCEIIGNGTLPFPLQIKFCKLHKKSKA